MPYESDFNPVPIYLDTYIYRRVYTRTLAHTSMFLRTCVCVYVSFYSLHRCASKLQIRQLRLQFDLFSYPI